MRWIVCVWTLTLLLTGCGQETTPDTHTSTDTTTTATTAGTTVTDNADEMVTTALDATSNEIVTTTAGDATTTTEVTTTTTTTTSKVTSTTKKATTSKKTTTTTKTSAATAAKATSTTSATTDVQSSTTTSAKPTVLSSTGHPIAVNKDDSWKYPLDVDACIADCKAYGESLGLTWDESLALDNASWSGEICTYQTTINPDEWDDRAEVFLDMDRFVREGNRRFHILFIPCHQTGAYGTIDGIYDIYAVSL